MEPWALINETYAAAADTKTHCKYGVPKKKTIVPGTRFIPVPITLAFDPSVRSSDNSFGGAPFFCVHARAR